MNNYNHLYKKYSSQPKDGWTRSDWLQESWVRRHSPWITEEEREYWKRKISEISNL